MKLNGKVFDDVKAGECFTVLHDWKLGDIMEIKFDMPAVVHTLAHHVAFTRGSVLLARDSRFVDGDITLRRAMPGVWTITTALGSLWNSSRLIDMAFVNLSFRRLCMLAGFGAAFLVGNMFLAVRGASVIPSCISDASVLGFCPSGICA